MTNIKEIFRFRFRFRPVWMDLKSGYENIYP